MKVAEIYRSLQGEGLLTGTDSVFLRTSGCNLRCWFCDTPFTSWSPEGDDMSVEEVLEAILVYDCLHVVITGGEPMLHAELVPVTSALAKAGKHITIETAGTLDLPVECQLISISPKLASSTPDARQHPRWHRRHEQTRHHPEVIRRLVTGYPYQLKFVVDTPGDFSEIERWLGELPEVDRQHVWLMPQGTTAEELLHRTLWLEPYCREHNFRFCPRRHIEWFGFTRGT